MSTPSKVLGFVGAAVGVVLAGILLGWLGTRTPQASSQTPIASNTPPETTHPIQAAPVATTPTLPATNTQAPATNSSATNLIKDWEDKLEEILDSNDDDATKVKQLLALFPRLPEDGQTEVAQHLSNLVEDKDYAPLGKLLADAKLPETVLDVLVQDVLNRPNSLKLPSLLDVASNPQHPKAEEAKDLLELFLEEDYGTDWAKWQTKMQQWLKDNPD
jgi:hypothetical protein